MGSEINGPDHDIGGGGRVFGSISKPKAWLIVIVVGLGFGAAYGARRFAQRPSPLDRASTALNKAYLRHRALDSRISGFEYAPFKPAGDKTIGKADLAANQTAEKLMLQAVYVHPDPASLHALGRFYLGRRDFKKALDQFDQAIRLEPNNPRLLSDRGAALAEQGKENSAKSESRQMVERLTAAIESLNKALELSPTLPEALFNRALLYEQMTLGERAQEAWRQYLAIDSNSRWGEEARQNLKRLKDSQDSAVQDASKLLDRLRRAQQTGEEREAWDLISQNRDRTGSVLVRETLNQFLEALHIGKPLEAEFLLGTLSFIAGLEKLYANDHFTHDLYSYYRREARAHQHELAFARDQLRVGVEHLNQADFTKAKEFFTRAKDSFERIGDGAEALQAEYLLSRCFRKQNEINARLSLYHRLSLFCERSHYQYLLSQIMMTQAQIHDGLANYSDVIAYTRRAMALTEPLQDYNTSAILMLQAATSYSYVGDHHQSLNLYFDALRLTSRRPSTTYIRWALNHGIGYPLNSLGKHAVAIEFLQASLDIARKAGIPWQVCRSHINLGATYGYIQKHDLALKNVNLAIDLAQRSGDDVFRRESIAFASHELGRLYNQSSDFAKAEEFYNQSLQFFEGLSTRQTFRYAAYKGKVVAALGRGESRSLEEYINTTLNLFEAYRVKIREESNRNRFFDLEQDIYDVAINFWRTQKSDEGAAFDLAERSRARSLLDAVTGGGRIIQDAEHPDLEFPRVAPPLSLSQIQRRTPDEAQIVLYAMLKDKLLIWVVSGSQPLVVREQKISDVELNKYASVYLQHVAKRPERSSAATTESARQLYEILIQPIVAFLDQKKKICIVPDKILNQIPFASLLAPDTGRFLIEDYEIIFAPSATMFVLCTETAAAKKNITTEKLLSVGDPAFDRRRFSLPYLSAASQGALDVAAYYDGSRTMVGEQATKQRLLEEISRIDVLHLALHCIVDQSSPMQSRLLLAKSTDESDPDEEILQAYEIYRLNLSRLRLVVLAACRSGVEAFYGGEGMIGVSRPFIAKGIPLVVASLWEVDSDATTELMRQFHQARTQRKLPTTASLRQAQRTLLSGSSTAYRHPYYWASFVSIGGYARF